MIIGSTLLIMTTVGALIPVQRTMTVEVSALALASLLVALSVYLATTWWLRIVEKRTVTSTGLTFNFRSLLGVLLGSGMSICAVWMTMMIGTTVAPDVPRPDVDPARYSDIPVGVSVIVVFITAFVLQAFPEELLFRGWLLSVDLERPNAMLIYSSLGFAAMHLISEGGQENFLETFLYLIPSLGFGFLAGILVQLTGNLWYAIGIHGGFHIGVELVSFVIPSEMAPFDWVVSGLIYMVIALFVWRRADARRQASGN